MKTWRVTSRAPLALAVLIALYAGMLRLDAFIGKYGTLDHPAWARIATQDVAPLAEHLRPSSVVWMREQRPYVGGDPANYIVFARNMETFYQPGVREPVFLALTRAGLWALDDQKAGVSFASMVGSITAVFGTYLLGAALLSPLVGLLAALVMAMEYQVISWAPDGWRDDVFTAAVVLAAWTLLRLRSAPTLWNAVLAGGLCGVACLTRITAISLVVPALIMLVVDGAVPSRRARFKYGTLALIVAAGVVAPYLISCAIAFGDPLFAVNYHTAYYRHAEGQPDADPMGVGEYVRTKIARRPVDTLDTAFIGLFVRPFSTKWRGLEHWMPGLGVALEGLALAGLAVMPFFPRGRLFLVILLTSLLPVTFTWKLGGGGEWRFTMHAYAFYIIAAAFAVVGAGRVVRSLARDPALMRRTSLTPYVRPAAGIAAAALLGTVAYFVLPWYVVREAIGFGESTSIETGTRDVVFYRSGWSRPHDESITVRVSRGERSTVRVPLPEKRNYDIVLRLDPVAPATQERVSVLFNKQLVGALRLTWDPERVGSYRVAVPERIVRVGSNELTIIPATLVAAGAAGPRFAWLDPADQAGVRLWYVRVLPSP